MKDTAYISALNFVWQKDKKNQQKFQQGQVEKQRPPPSDVQKKTSEKKIEIGEETVFQNKLSLHIETDNIC